jgi:hypothetical protein
MILSRKNVNHHKVTLFFRREVTFSYFSSRLGEGIIINIVAKSPIGDIQGSRTLGRNVIREGGFGRFCLDAAFVMVWYATQK